MALGAGRLHQPQPAKLAGQLGARRGGGGCGVRRGAWSGCSKPTWPTPPRWCCRPSAAGPAPARPRPASRLTWRRRRRGGGGPGRAAAGAMRFGNTVGAALTATRALGAAEAPTLIAGGTALVTLGGLGRLEARAAGLSVGRGRGVARHHPARGGVAGGPVRRRDATRHAGDILEKLVASAGKRSVPSEGRPGSGERTAS